MLKENLLMLRNINGYSQEAVAEKIGISRQAYAKWESGATVPDIGKCALLADLYSVSVDSLIRDNSAEGVGTLPPAPKGKYIWGSVVMGDRGQVVIPKDAREKFGLTGGSRLIVLSDEVGIVMMPAEKFEEQMRRVMEYASLRNEEDPQ